jgi:hypothetical protein
VRQNPIHDSFDDRDEPPREVPAQVRRVSTTSGVQGTGRRGEVRYMRASQRPAVRRGPDPRVWFIRGSIGVAALAGLWLGLQAAFPMNESRVNEAPAPTLTVDATTTSAPEPTAVAQAAPPEVAQPAPAAPADSGQPAPGQSAPPPAAPAQPAAEAAAPPQPQAQPTVIPAPPAPPQPTQPPLTQPTPVADRLPGLQPRPGEAANEPAPAPAAPPQEAAASEDAAPTQQIASAQPAQPPADPAATPTAAPIPPPENPQPAPRQAAPPPIIAAAPPAPAPARPAAPPAAASGGGFALAASASPANPISEQAQVTVTVKATQNGAPLAGALCIATIYYRTATAKQPVGGFTTNGNGVGAFTLDARGTTYGYYIPIDVTCTGRAGTATTRTGFTPVKGR